MQILPVRSDQPGCVVASSICGALILEEPVSFASFSIFGIAAAVMASAAQAAQSTIPEFAPNPAVGWILTNGGYDPPPMGAGPIRQDPAHPLISNDDFRRSGRQPTMPVADLSNPVLQPWTQEELRKRNEAAIAGKSLSLGATCWPMGGAAFLQRNIQPYFFVQGPDRVVIVEQHDGQFRQIYLTDHHSVNVKPSWNGESIGHYERNALVVDTIGISTQAPVDKFYTPHTAQLHVTERFRMTDDGNRMEVRVHVEDPGAFTMPWDGILGFRRVEPGRAENTAPMSPVTGAMPAGPLVEMRCAENPFSYFGNATVPVPRSDTPDF